MMCDKHNNVEQIINLVKQMSDNAAAIKDLMPESQCHSLRHIAASCIHLLSFMKDLIHTPKIDEYEESEEAFLKECGCNIDDPATYTELFFK